VKTSLPSFGERLLLKLVPDRMGLVGLEVLEVRVACEGFPEARVLRFDMFGVLVGVQDKSQREEEGTRFLSGDSIW
jgi:hypothetical protein